MTQIASAILFGRRPSSPSHSSGSALALYEPVCRSKAEIEEEAVSLGLVTKSAEDREAAVKTPRGRLISSIYDSWKAKRAIGHASLVLLGNAGVGKSSTVNHVLGIDIARTSSFQSETRSTTEYILETSDPVLGASDLTLSIVDPPGFNDTTGLEQDACNLLSILRFHKNHPSFGDGAFPNVILVTLQATDMRFGGDNSLFVRSLKAVKRTGMVDTQRANVVAVITWASALSERKRKAKEAKVKEILLRTLNVDAPVVYVENDLEDLEVEGDFTRLPDGTLQPKNLFEAMVQVMRDAGDRFGQHCISRFFEQNGKFDLSKGLVVPAKDVKREHMDPKEMELFRELSEDGAMKTGVPPVAQKLNKFIDNVSLTEDQRNEILSLGADLVENVGLLSVEDLRQYSVGQLRQLLRRQPSPFAEETLQMLFNLRTEPITPNALLAVGKGFNILGDEMKPMAIFKVDESAYQQTPFGIRIPKGIQMSTVKHTATFMEHFEEDSSYVKQRLTQLNVNLTVDPSLFSMKSRGGFTRGQTSNFFAMEHSFLFEQRLFKLEMTNWREEMVFTNSFKNAVMETLPSSYDRKDADNRRDFEDFFNTWGHFAVASAYGGGMVEVKTKMVSSGNVVQSTMEARAELESQFRMLTTGVGFVHNSTESSANRSKLDTTHTNWTGGDEKFHMMSTTDGDPDKWNKWVTSLSAQPAVLTTEMSLIPIYELVGHINPSRRRPCLQALSDFLGGKFTVMAKKEQEQEAVKKEEEILKTRDSTAAANRPSDEDEAGKCFPGNSVVLCRSGVRKRMSELEVGDRVLCCDPATGRTAFSEVYMFGHRDAQGRAFYLTATCADGSAVSISREHLIFAGPRTRSKFAGDLKVGDLLFVVNGRGELETSEVVAVRNDVVLDGLFAPFTKRGTIVVDGVAASCYAEVGGLAGVSGHALAHAFTAPLRLSHSAGIGRKEMAIGKGETMPGVVKKLRPWVMSVLPSFARL